MYAPTAAGVVRERPERARAKMTKQQPERGDDLGEEVGRRGPVLGGELERRLGEHDVGHHGAEDAARDLRRQIGGGVPPAHPAERRVDEGHHRVEVAARDRPEHQDDGEQAGRRRGRVLEELQPGVARGELLGGDARPDDERGQEGAAQELGRRAGATARPRSRAGSHRVVLRRPRQQQDEAVVPELAASEAARRRSRSRPRRCPTRPARRPAPCRPPRGRHRGPRPRPCPARRSNRSSAPGRPWPAPRPTDARWPRPPRPGLMTSTPRWFSAPPTPLPRASRRAP